MTALELVALKPGDTLVSTGDLSGYPHYHVLAGARFVVVSNDMGDAPGSHVSIRLAPADKGKLVAGDISEWGDAIHLHEPMSAEEHDAGVDPADRAAPGNAWSKHKVDLVRAPDALTVAERLAALFAHNLAEDIGDDDGMAEVIRRNAAETNPGICHSHDLCDANMSMLASFEALGQRTPLDAIDDPSLGDGPTDLWNEAWDLTKASWFVAPSWALNQEPEEDDEATPGP